MIQQGKTSSSSTSPNSTFITGLGILFLAQVLSALMGLHVQRTYEMYGTHWRENLFYSHFLSLPLFIPFIPSMRTRFASLAASEPLSLPSAWTETLPSLVQSTMTKIPSQVALLAANAITQYACIRGVNLLGARSSALTVTIVLNVRKLASLLFSIWLFGNRLAPGVLAGASVVFASGALYAWESQRQRRADAVKREESVVEKSTAKGA